jgi:hypothetical protein
MNDTTTQAPKSAKTVTVACKLPNGVVLHVDEMVEEHEPVMGGGTRKIQVARRRPETAVINGNAVAVGQTPRHQMFMGYAMTPDVDADLWAKWLEQHKDSLMVKNKLIFAMAGRDNIEAKAKEHADQRSGLEPLDPTFKVGTNGAIIPNDPRYPRSMNPNLSAVHQADRVA